MLLVDGDDQLTLSHVSHPIVNQPTPQMRIGVGGLFISPNELLVLHLTAELGNQTVLLLPLPQGGCLDSPLLLRVTPSSFTLRLGHTEISKPTPKAEFESLQQLWLSNMGSLVIGGESGEEKSQEAYFFHGCLSVIRVQGHELDFDEAQYRSNSISAHSCPGSVEGKVDGDDGQ